MDIKTRLRNDFFRPSKEGDYELILKTAQDYGYEFHTVLSFEDVLKEGLSGKKKYLILRRDIDTADFKILRKMLALEKKYGARATYYFRWTTLNIKLMQDIEDAGGEASYHYEEIATFCYRHHVKQLAEVKGHMGEIQDLFIENCKKFRNVTGRPCLTVASHGDYMNVRLQYQNYELMNNRVRCESGITREAYDPEHMAALSCRIADQVDPDSFAERSIEALRRGEPVLELLTHPRQWNSPIWVNLKEEIQRVCKQIYMSI